jgi:hypothetical protein
MPATPDSPPSATYPRVETADCSPGKNVAGGGYTIGGGVPARVVITASWPSDANTWSVSIEDDFLPGPTPNITDVDVFALCVNP